MAQPGPEMVVPVNLYVDQSSSLASELIRNKNNNAEPVDGVFFLNSTSKRLEILGCEII